MAAVQDVEDAVGEHQRPGKRGEPAREVGGLADLFFEGRRLHFFSAVAGTTGRQRLSPDLQYSNTFTTFFTPSVVRAISDAALASTSVTMPIRKTTLASVTTLTWTGLKFFAPRKRVLTLEVTTVSPLRAASEVSGPIVSSLASVRTPGTALTSFSTSACVTASGT